MGLSPIQKHVLRCLTEEYLTPKQIANRRGTSTSAVYKIIRKLRKKGYISIGNKGGVTTINPPKNIQPPTDKLQHGIRLHAQEFNCKILWKSAAYDKLLNQKNIIYFDNNTIRLFRNAIEVYSSSSRSFLAEDEQKATALSLKYWSTFFGQLEQRLRVILIKGVNTKIRQVNAHYAEINNELAKGCNERKVRISIFGTEDAKLWFKVDNSWQLNEAEALHPEASKQDMAKIKAFFNDIRDNTPPTVTELFSMVSGNLRATQDLITHQQMYAENIASHIQAIKDLGQGVDRLTKLIDELRRN